MKRLIKIGFGDWCLLKIKCNVTLEHPSVERGSRRTNSFAGGYRNDPIPSQTPTTSPTNKPDKAPCEAKKQCFNHKGNLFAILCSMRSVNGVHCVIFGRNLIYNHEKCIRWKQGRIKGIVDLTLPKFYLNKSWWFLLCRQNIYSERSLVFDSLLWERISFNRQCRPKAVY